MMLMSVCMMILPMTTSFQIASSRVARALAYSSIEMKGKGGKVPINQRGEFVKRQKMLDIQAKIESNKPKGVPVFKIFVRQKTGGLWIPCGDLAGDQKATALVNAYTSGFLNDLYKNQLDQGVARSVFGQSDTFVKNIIENFKPFKKCGPDDLQFGYKIEYDSLTEKMGEQKVTILDKSMEKGWFDGLKEKAAGFFQSK